jgi:hypothetical protein
LGTPIKRIKLCAQKQFTPIQRLFSRDRSTTYTKDISSPETFFSQASPIDPSKSDPRAPHIRVDHDKLSYPGSHASRAVSSNDWKSSSVFTLAISGEESPAQDDPMDTANTRFLVGSRLFESLKESSDPWALMGRELLDLDIPTLSSRLAIRAEDAELLERSMSKCGVGFVSEGSYVNELTSLATAVDDEVDAAHADETILNFESSQPARSLDDYQQEIPMRKSVTLSERVLHLERTPLHLPVPSSNRMRSFMTVGVGELTARVDGESEDEHSQILPPPALEDAHKGDPTCGTESLEFFLSQCLEQHAFEDTSTFDELASGTEINAAADSLYPNNIGALSFSPSNHLNASPSSNSLAMPHSLDRIFQGLTPIAQNSWRPNYASNALPAFNDTQLGESSEEVEPTDSQLLAMYTNPDESQDLAAGSLLVSAGFATNDQVFEHLEDDDPEDTTYSGPCLFSD